MIRVILSVFTSALLCLCVPHSAQAAISLSTVYVGDAGNPADAGTGRGSVGYDFLMGKYEVTISQYTAFLNAVARTDTYSLWNISIGGNLSTRGISRAGASGSYRYSAIGYEDRPIANVSWFNAARFANWMDNGQPTGPQGPGTTETGTYALNGATTGTGFTRAAGAHFVLPTADEWYKAGYYHPASSGGPAGDYWLYPTRSNTQPNSRNGSTSDPNSANYYYDDGIANGYNGGYATINATTYTSQNMLTRAGAFTLASSYYGTFDQGGNVAEMSEDCIQLGGAFTTTEVVLRLDMNYNFGDPTWIASNAGFRVAYVPEPASAWLMLLGAALMGARRR